MRTDRDVRDMQMRRMSEEDRSIEAKKEQARLSKHVVCHEKAKASICRIKKTCL
jgi:hypothetical protein